MDILLSSLAVFISTSIDEIFILLIIFATIGKNKFLDVFIGQYMGTAFLVFVSLIIAYFLKYIPEDWIIGLLGLIPIGLGIRYALVGEEENEEEEVIETIKSNSRQLFLGVALVTIASGGDNLGIYIPYFTALNTEQILFVMIVFSLMTFLLNYGANQLSEIKMFGEWLEKHERWIIPITFILLGFYILVENGTLQHFIF